VTITAGIGAGWGCERGYRARGEAFVAVGIPTPWVLVNPVVA
jgi:hypothetical protein